MFRLSGLISIALAVICGTALFWTSQSVQRADYKLSQVEQENATEIESLRVLSAEWDYLNRPSRLEKLTLGNLGMDEALVESESFIGASEEIPEPVAPVLPKVKPEFLQHVSTSKKIELVAPTKPATIQKSEREDFNKLIESFSEEGQE